MPRHKSKKNRNNSKNLPPEPQASINNKHYQELEKHFRTRFPEEFKGKEMVDVLEEWKKLKESENLNNKANDRSMGSSTELEADLHRRLDKLTDEMSELRAREVFSFISDDETDPNRKDNKNRQDIQPEKRLDTKTTVEYECDVNTVTTGQPPFHLGPEPKSKTEVALAEAFAALKVYQKACSQDHSRDVEKFECSCHSAYVLLKSFSKTTQ